MLSELKLDRELSKEEYKSRIKPIREALARESLRVKAERVPVVILFEGFGAAGKGSYISELILNWDPRGFRVFSTREPDVNQARRPWLWRFWENLPEYGKIAVFDRSWYRDVTVDRVNHGLDDETIDQMYDDINTFERQLTDDGYCVIKLFLCISCEEQKKRFTNLRASEHTAWRVTDDDLMHNRQYKRHFAAFDEMIRRTDTPNAPWHAVATTDRRYGTVTAFEIIANAMKEAVDRAIEERAARAARTEPLPVVFDPGVPVQPIKKLAEVNLDCHIEDDRYKQELERCRTELAQLHNRIYRAKLPVVIAYEGWDAAGKGGNIKRLVSSFDARGYGVIPIAAPIPAELNHHYLWRFWREMPRTGHIAIFDRSWYGRVMVERIEGFCTQEQWMRAYREINEFEKFLADWNTVVVKFWLHIDPDEQLRRFQNRAADPNKAWKLSDEDWRNREKWDQYEEAVDDMLRCTNTEYAPWYIIESNEKKYARIRVMKIMIDTLHRALGD